MNSADLGMILVWMEVILSTVEQLKYFTEHKSREEIMNAEKNYLNDSPNLKNCYTSQKQTWKLTEMPNWKIPTLFSVLTVVTGPGSVLYLFPHWGVCIYSQWYIHSHLGILALGSAKKCICRTVFCKIALIGFAITAKNGDDGGFFLWLLLFQLKMASLKPLKLDLSLIIKWHGFI